MKKFLSCAIIAFGIVADQLLKFWVVANIPLNTEREFISGLLSLTYLRNYGAAWSILEGQQWIFNLLTPIALGVALYFLWKRNEEIGYNLALSFILAGAVGNWIDRLRQGFVVDMFQTEFMTFAIFNIADIFLSIGFVILVVAMLLDKED